MARERPRLEVLSGGPEVQEGPAPAASPAAPAPRRERGPGWVLAALLGMALLALAIQTRRAVTLSDEVEALNGEVGRLVTELAHTQTALEAHRSHLSEVRGAVEQLRELVIREPSPARGEPAPAGESR